MEVTVNVDNPFTYSLSTYVYIVLLSTIAGFVKFLNACVKTNEFKILILVRDLFTGIVAGLLAFWICDFFGLVGPLSNVAVVVAGMMGIQAVEEIKNIVFTILNVYVAKK